jgi:hypothetical protein
LGAVGRVLAVIAASLEEWIVSDLVSVITTIVCFAFDEFEVFVVE